MYLCGYLPQVETTPRDVKLSSILSIVITVSFPVAIRRLHKSNLREKERVYSGSHFKVVLTMERIQRQLEHNAIGHDRPSQEAERDG